MPGFKIFGGYMNPIKIFLSTLILIVILYSQIYPKVISGKIMDFQSNYPLDSVKIEAVKDNTIIKTFYTDYSGHFILNIPDSLSSSVLKIRISKDGYLDKIISFNIDTISFFIEKILPKAYSVSPITIYSNDYKNLGNFIGILEGKELINKMSSTLSYTLEDEVEISIHSMGPAATKPTFRGLSSNYFKILENNLPVKDLSFTAPDHSIAVDPLSYSKIEIIRGPRVLLYSGSTLAGVVNLTKRDYFFEAINKPSIDINLLYESAFSSKNLSLKGELPLPPLFLAPDFEFKQGGDMKSALGIVPNTYFKSFAGNLISGYQNSFLSFYGLINGVEMKYGVPGGFSGAHPKGVDIKLERYSQSVRGLLHFYTFLDNIEINLSRSYYHHAEFEKRGAIGAEFLLNNLFSNINFSFGKMNILNEAIFGLAYEHTNQKYGGYVFAPNTVLSSYATYFYSSFIKDFWFFEFSLRFSHSIYYPNESNSLRRNLPINRIFNTFSSSISIFKNLNETTSLGLIISRSERNPSIEELYSNGPHLAAYSFEVGNSDLKSELGYGLELTTSFKKNIIEISTSIFDYEFPRYNYPLNTGDTNYSQLLPIYRINSTRARISGLSLITTINLIKTTSLVGSLSYTRGFNLSTATFLPMIPPLKGQVRINHKLFHQTNINFETKFSFRQNFLGENESPTPGYLILNFGADHISTLWKTPFVFSLRIENITNKIYWNHLSRIKSIFPEPGRNFKISINMFI